MNKGHVHPTVESVEEKVLYYGRKYLSMIRLHLLDSVESCIIAITGSPVFIYKCYSEYRFSFIIRGLLLQCDMPNLRLQ